MSQVRIEMIYNIKLGHVAGLGQCVQTATEITRLHNIRLLLFIIHSGVYKRAISSRWYLLNQYTGNSLHTHTYSVYHLGFFNVLAVGPRVGKPHTFETDADGMHSRSLNCAWVRLSASDKTSQFLSISGAKIGSPLFKGGHLDTKHLQILQPPKTPETRAIQNPTLRHARDLVASG